MVTWMDSNAWGLESEALGAGAVRVVGLAQRRGAAEDFAARSFLLKLAERELIELPPVREYKRVGANAWVGEGEIWRHAGATLRGVGATTACTARLGGSRQRGARRVAF